MIVAFATIFPRETRTGLCALATPLRIYVLVVRDGFTLLSCVTLCGCLVTVGGWVCLAFEDVGLGFYGWSWVLHVLCSVIMLEANSLSKRKTEKRKSHPHGLTDRTVLLMSSLPATAGAAKGASKSR